MRLLACWDSRLKYCLVMVSVVNVEILGTVQWTGRFSCPEESYRVWCDGEALYMRWHWLTVGCSNRWHWLTVGCSERWHWLTVGCSNRWHWLSVGCSDRWHWLTVGSSAMDKKFKNTFYYFDSVEISEQFTYILKKW